MRVRWREELSCSAPHASQLVCAAGELRNLRIGVIPTSDSNNLASKADVMPSHPRVGPLICWVIPWA